MPTNMELAVTNIETRNYHYLPLLLVIYCYIQYDIAMHVYFCVQDQILKVKSFSDIKPILTSYQRIQHTETVQMG